MSLITIGDYEFDPTTVDVESARKWIKAPNGRLLVEVLEPPEKSGAIFLPDVARRWLRPAVGVVIASADDAYEVGEVVIFRPSDGTVRSKFTHGEYRANGHVRCFGVYVPSVNKGECIPFNVGDSVVAKIVDGEIVPTRAHCLVLREGIVETAGPLVLQEHRHYRTNIGTITAVGPNVDSAYPVGTRVVYHPSGPIEILLPGANPDLAVMDQAAFEAILTP